MPTPSNFRPATKRDVEVIAREPMTNWFSPAQLIRTGVKVVLGLVFGTYLDRREVEAALLQHTLAQEALALNYADRDELWLDYVADTGDGWDSSYSVALLLAQERLTLGGVSTPRGEILVMGGDEVYPTSTVDDYENKLRNPYRSALPWVAEGARPDLFVLPGNHDWYDGLASFLKVFCQQRSIGAWQTRQTRSYFALKLPHDWWLWAVDIQLETDIDHPQIAYFDYFARQLRQGHRVILCTPTSSWTEAGDDEESARKEQRSHQNLSFLEDRIRRSGAEVAVNIAGDLHHYSHYESPEKGAHKFTAGGGGAYLFGTHELPRDLLLYEGRESKEHYVMKTAYPDAAQSKRLRLGTLGFFYKNLAFSLFLGGLYLLYTWLLQSESKIPNAHLAATLMEDLARLDFGIASFCSVLTDVYWVLAHSPGATLFTLFIVVSLWGFCDGQPGVRGAVKRIVFGGGHGVLHVLLAIVLLWCFSRLNLGPIADWLGRDAHSGWVDHPLQALLFLVEMLGGGIVLGGTLMGLYLVAANFAGMHGQDVFSAQAIPDYKNFLRLHLTREGLTVYPVGVPQAHRRWKLSAAAQAREVPPGMPRGSWAFSIPQAYPGPWLEPDDDLAQPFLMEPPVQIVRR